MNFIGRWCSFILLCTVVASCVWNSKVTTSTHRDWTTIKDNGSITIITLYSSTSYFIYKDKEMGYEFELLEDFAQEHKLNIQVKVASNVQQLTQMLLNGEGDVVVYNLPVTNELKKKLRYCGRKIITQQVLVQRAQKNDTLLTDVIDLIGKEVWVPENTKYYDRLVNLDREIGGGILIRTINKDTLNTEDLIELVSTGKLSYTVTDDILARVNKTYYANLDIDLKISHPQRSSWAVNQESVDLASTLDNWFATKQNTTRYRAIMKRYFEMSKSPFEQSTEYGLLLGKGKISPFDVLFKKYAPTIQKDWRLLAAMAFQESRFDTTGMSWAGAVGLMGLMPGTAEQMGIEVEQRQEAEASIYAATKYLALLESPFRGIEDDTMRLKFVLASYNAGIGHVFDARALAQKYGKNPQEWNDVSEYIRLKSLPEYYNDSVCKHGYLRGSETAAYVHDIINRWHYYKEKVPK